MTREVRLIKKIYSNRVPTNAGRDSCNSIGRSLISTNQINKKLQFVCRMISNEMKKKNTQIYFECNQKSIYHKVNMIYVVSTENLTQIQS